MQGKEEETTIAIELQKQKRAAQRKGKAERVYTYLKKGGFQRNQEKVIDDASSLVKDLVNEIKEGDATDETYKRGQDALAQIEQGGEQFANLPKTPQEDLPARRAQAGEERQDEAKEHYDRFKKREEGYTSKRDAAFNPERLQALAHQKDGAPSALSHLENAGLYSDNRKERKEQKKQNEKDILDDYTTDSFSARKGEKRGPKIEGTKRTAGIKATPPSKGMVSGGKLAGKGLTKVAESGGAAGSLFIYGLAILNDFPDIADWMLEALLAAVAGLGPIIDFLFDAVVFLGFRYFLRAHMNVSKVRLILYGATILELIPGPLDVLPFWTLCAWMVLRQIKEEQENKQKLIASGATEAGAKRKAGNLRRNRIEEAMEGA